ncbi:MAG: Holliday junction resolvase-like protein [Spirochaetales bacterium]|nr:Holliday junction resolvase-like protein [Spirochaetales bacterium]
MVDYIEFILIAIAAALIIIVAFKIGRITGRKKEAKDWESNKIESIVKERIKLSRAVLGGQFSEQLAPYLPGFDFNPNECRFIGKPIDFVVFKGMDEGRVDEIVLVEVKSGKNRNLSKIERALRDAVKDGRVSWQQYDVPEGVTK